MIGLKKIVLVDGRDCFAFAQSINIRRKEEGMKRKMYRDKDLIRMGQF
jgi:hypothetical protein